MDTDVVPLSHFVLFVTCMYAKDTNFIFGIPQIYTCTDTQTCTHICRDTSIYRYRHIHTDIHKHTCRHTQTHMHIFYIHKHTYIYYRSILPAHFIFSCHLPNELRSPWTYFFKKFVNR